VKKVARSTAGNKPASSGTRAAASPPSLARPKLITSLYERRQVLQRSKFNADVHAILDAAVELREQIIAFCNRADASRKADGDPALLELDLAGIDEPHADAWFGRHTFGCVGEKFGEIAEAIEDAQVIRCTLPPPPVADRRAA
jgi:hypothetical protein